MANGKAFSRRGFLAAGFAGLALPALAGCASSVSAGLVGAPLNPRTLIYWNLFGGGDGTRMETMEAGYQKTHGGASSLQSTTFAWGNPYYSKVTLATVGHKPPDVAISHLTRAKPLWDGGILDPITDEDLALIGVSPSDFNQAPWKAQQTDGHNIAIPLDTHPTVMFYNLDVLKKAGLLGSDGLVVPLDSMDKFEAALAEISKVTKGYALTIANVAGETATPWRVFTTLYHQHADATPFLSDNGAKLSVNWEVFDDVTSRLQSWVKKGWVNSGLDYATAENYVFTGKTGLYFEGEWELTTGQLIKGAHFDMAPIPTLYDQPAAQADSHTFVLPKKDRTPAERKQALDFIKSMLTQSMTWAMGGHVPAYLPIANSDAYHKLLPQAHYASAAQHAVYDDPAWYGGSGSTFENIVGAELGLVQQGVATPAQAREAITSQLKIYLDTPSPL